MTKPFWNDPDSGKREYDIAWRTLTPPQRPKPTMPTPEQAQEIKYRRHSRDHFTALLYPNGELKTLKNLGWLLKNWQRIERFEAYAVQHPYNTFDCVLVAYVKYPVYVNGNQDMYITSFASETAMLDWLHRPVFRGVPLTLIAEDETRTETVC